jgi:hypothetical protein
LVRNYLRNRRERWKEIGGSEYSFMYSKEKVNERMKEDKEEKGGSRGGVNV